MHASHYDPAPALLASAKDAAKRARRLGPSHETFPDCRLAFLLTLGALETHATGQLGHETSFKEWFDLRERLLDAEDLLHAAPMLFRSVTAPELTPQSVAELLGIAEAALSRRVVRTTAA